MRSIRPEDFSSPEEALAALAERDAIRRAVEEDKKVARRVELKEYAKAWHSANAGTVASRNRVRYSEKRDEIITQVRVWATANMDLVAGYSRKASALARSGITGRAKILISDAKKRATKYGVEFNISLSFVVGAIERGTCPKTGRVFSFERPEGHHRNPNAPSLDRITPGGNYTEDNTQITCCAYNIGKQDLSEDEFLQLCKDVVRMAAGGDNR